VRANHKPNDWERAKSENVHNTQVSAPTKEHYVTDTVTSREGTIISYRKLGRGPGLVLLHGSMESDPKHMGLAKALSKTFTVYLPGRRGHSENIEAYSMRKEVEDLAALPQICLQAALELPAIHKIDLHEPALIVNGSVSTTLLPRFDWRYSGRVWDGDSDLSAFTQN
jgi:hypothetical protein